LDEGLVADAWTVLKRVAVEEQVARDASRRRPDHEIEPDVARRRQPRVRHPPSESQTRARVGGRDDVAQRCAAVRDEVHPEGGAYWRRETCRVFEPRDRSRLERDLATPIGRAVVRRTRAVRDALRETSKRWRTSDAQRDRERVRALG